MQFSNPKIPEGINRSRENPLKEFAILSCGVALVIVLAVLALSQLTIYFAPKIPFSTEKKLAERYENFFNLPSDEKHQEIEAYLQTVTDKMARHMDWPDDMKLTVHYVNSEEINAFATLAGHIMITKGLLSRVSDEQSLAMVLAHEAAHIRQRDPIKALARSATVSLMLALVTDGGGGSAIGEFIGSAGLATVLSFNRNQERTADELALQSLYGQYQSLYGAKELFQIFQHVDHGPALLQSPPWLSTHPLTQERIDAVTHYANEQAWQLEAYTSHPLPKNISEQIQSQE